MPSLETFAQDLRFGARALRRNPGFAAIAIVTLALGIGANAAIFSVVRAVLLQPLPWHEPDRAVMIWSKWTAFDKTWVATGEVVDYRRRSQTLAEVAAWGTGQVNLTGDGEPERIGSASVSANIFTTLGIAPISGRGFTPEEDLPNGPQVAILGHGLWSRRYAADPSIVGRSIQINGRPYEVVGILAPGTMLPTDFQNPQPSQIWLPLQMDPASTDHGSHGFFAAGRLKPGATVQQAADELHGIAQAMTKEGLYPVQMEFDTVVLSLTDEVVGPVRPAIWLLLGAVAFLLLIACANVANLLLARGEGRQREIAIRAALGAGSWRVVRQLLTESLVLTCAAALVGLVLAYGGVRFVAWWNPASVPRIAAVRVDFAVLLFTAAVAIATNVVFGVAPALRALRIDLTDALKDGAQGASSSGARPRFRNMLVVAEMALAVVLLVGAGLMLRSLWSLQRIELGFDPSRVLTMSVTVPAASYQAPEQVVGFYSRAIERVRAIPGVRTAGAVRSLPLASTIGDFGLMVDGYVPPPGTNAKGDWQIATPGYIEAIGERVIRGRSIQDADGSDGMLVALVNEEMAARYWHGRDALGGRFRIGGGNPASRPWVTVVGIVANVRHNGLTDVVKEKFYVPHTQWPRSVGNAIRSMTIVVKADGDPERLAVPVRQAIREIDPNLPVANVTTMDAVVASTLSAPRFTGMLLGVFAALALALSAIGIYGVLSYVVSRRTREIGIRVAIGAGRAQVLGLVLRSGLGFAVAGIVTGLAAAAALSRAMTTLLHGVTPADPMTYAAVAVTLTLVALAASLIPALRATRVSPLKALRME